MFDDPNGVRRAAQSYGYDFLVVRDSLRHSQVTVTHGNSQSNSQELMGTLRYSAHLLARFSDGELRDLVETCSRGHSKFSSPESCQSSQSIVASTVEHSNYREVQYHAPLAFNTDFEVLVITIQHSHGVLYKIIQFAAKNCIDVRITIVSMQAKALELIGELGYEHRLCGGMIKWIKPGLL